MFFVIGVNGFLLGNMHKNTSVIVMWYNFILGNLYVFENSIKTVDGCLNVEYTFGDI